MKHFIPQISQLENLLFPDDAWMADSIDSLLNSEINNGIILQHEESLLGYCLYQIVFETAELLRIGVQPNHQNQGIGTQILNEFIAVLTQKKVESVLLEVRADNHSAINFYQKHDFRTLHVRKNYYILKNGQSRDALIMQKLLTS